MKLICRETADECGDYVARLVRDRINAFGPTAERPYVLGLPTGSTPIPAYKRLVEFVQAGELSFGHVVTFNMDEYVGLPREHPESYWSFMHVNLFDHVDILPENINILAPAGAPYEGWYEVFVHDYPGTIHEGSTQVTVNIYLNGALTQTYGFSMTGEDDDYYVAKVHWPTGAITACNGLAGCP